MISTPITAIAIITKLYPHNKNVDKAEDLILSMLTLVIYQTKNTATKNSIGNTDFHFLLQMFLMPVNKRTDLWI